MAFLLLVWQSGPGPETAPVGPGRGQERRRGLCGPGEHGLLQELCPRWDSGALDAGYAGER